MWKFATPSSLCLSTFQFSSGPRKSLVPKASLTGKRGKCATATSLRIKLGWTLVAGFQIIFCRHLSACFELLVDLCNNFHRRSHGLMKKHISNPWFQLIKRYALWEPNHTIAETSQFATFADCHTRSPSNQQPLLKGLTLEVWSLDSLGIGLIFAQSFSSTRT